MPFSLIFYNYSLKTSRIIITKIMLRGVNMARKTLALVLVFTMAVTFFCGSLGACASPEIKAKSAILIEPTTGMVIIEHNADEKLPEASVTKVMTILLVLEAIDEGKLTLESKISCSEYAASMGGSQIWLEPGEVMTVHELLKAMIVASANDAAVALGEAVSGSNDAFVALMNERAAQLKMTGTVYKNCTGLHEEGHYTTARDIAIVTAEVLKHELVFEYTGIWMDYLRNGTTELVNTNKLLRRYVGITGMKTGTTSEAGKCLSATAQRDGLSLVAVVLGSETSDDRFNTAKALLDYGFANYEIITPATPQDTLTPIGVSGGMAKDVEVYCEGFDEIIVPKGKSGEIKVETELSEELTAPVEKGQTVGKIKLILDGEELASCPVKTVNSVNKITVSGVFKKIFQALLNLQG